MLSPETVMTVMQNAIWTVILTAAPPLILGLIVGLMVSLFQTITSIQEATLAFVPKILAVFLALIFFGAWMINNLTGFTRSLFYDIPYHLLS
ncbi:MAG: flagellar biosynthesis protein FliQ [Defluviitaleaceae bacterium]|nr:flagellar biosynthesis protein FliQ [Defluviitaleaceae bacterium]